MWINEYTEAIVCLSTLFHSTLQTFIYTRDSHSASKKIAEHTQADLTNFVNAIYKDCYEK